MIELRDLCFTYRTGTVALDNISAVFRPGTISAVLGESGSGKTTLLMLLGRFLQPTAGHILCDGQPVNDLPEREFRRRIGIVFQGLFLFPHLTVSQNLTLAVIHVMGCNRGEARRQARQMLEHLGIAGLAGSYPAQISGGQAQRVAIARGLLLRPEYMLLDEPTSALDAGTTDSFAEWLLTLRSDTNFIIVTHDLPFARRAAAEGITLSEGRVIASGPVEKLILSSANGGSG